MSPRSAKKNEEIRQETMLRIMDAAFLLIARQGYESTSIAQIASEARVSKGLLYNYFVSKEDLLEKLIQHAMMRKEDIVATASSEGPALVLENLFRWFFRELRERPDYWRLITELTLKIDKFKFVHDIAVEKMKEYTGVLEELFASMGFENPAGEAKLVAALFDGIGIQALVLKEDYPLDDMERILIKKYCSRKILP